MLILFTFNNTMDLRAFLNILTYLDIDSKILMRRINKQFDQQIGQIKFLLRKNGTCKTSLQV
jgi:hypothetical protein